jgi:Flp pilus assembly protein TadD
MWKMPTREERYDEAIALQQSGNLAEAVERLDALVRQEPDYALAHSALSVFHSKLGQNDQAVDHANQACALEPDDPFCFVALSLICQKAGRIAEAEQALMKARQVEFAPRRGADS